MKSKSSRLAQTCALALSLVMSSVASGEPADEYVVELYETYCLACHSIEGTGAPRAFNTEQWSALSQQKGDQMVNNAITGVGNMPAQGGCMECAYEDFEDLIDYMSKPKPSE